MIIFILRRTLENEPATRWLGQAGSLDVGPDCCWVTPGTEPPLVCTKNAPARGNPDKGPKPRNAILSMILCHGAGKGFPRLTGCWRVCLPGLCVRVASFACAGLLACSPKLLCGDKSVRRHLLRRKARNVGRQQELCVTGGEESNQDHG
jgi:hypothetical protein